MRVPTHESEHDASKVVDLQEEVNVIIQGFSLEISERKSRPAAMEDERFERAYCALGIMGRDKVDYRLV